MLRKALIYTSICLTATHLHAQNIQVGLAGGGMMYHGDLSGKPLFDMRSATAASVHFAPNDRFLFSAEYMFGHIGASDLNRPEISDRNLHFDSYVFEHSVNLRVNLVTSPRWAFIPYLQGGAAVFYVNPFTSDVSGNRVYLYYAHTEGRGLPQFPDLQANQLRRLSIPMGGGFELKVTSKLSLDVEAMTRFTNSDQLDDVGGVYPDISRLKGVNSPFRRDLSYRGLELPGTNNYYPSAGTPRGNAEKRDWYSSIHFRLRYTLFGETGGRRRTLMNSDNWMY
jgi:Domain of unknown function (DUF6089)